MTTDWTPQLRKLGRGATRDIQAVLQFAEESGGWTGRRLRGGHIMLRHDRGGSTVIPFTSASRRGLANARAQIRREAR